MNNRKIGFWGVVSLVIGSQIGSGALSAPAMFANFGWWSTLSFVVAGIGALSLSYVFAKLCFLFPHTGGPHIYIKNIFGHTLGFFTGWIYWMISWISTIVVLIACVDYLYIIYPCNKMLLGLIVWSGINLLNLISIDLTSRTEIALTVLKVVFFTVFIIAPIYYFDTANIISVPNMPFSASLSAALWGFIGLEVATTPADPVHDPKHTIPKAVLWGTGLVAILYLLSNIAALGVLPASVLSVNASPYSVISKKIFGTSYITNLVAFFVCLGSINAWALSAGQVSLGLAKDKFLPASFAKTYREVPFVGILISYIGISLLWICGLHLHLLTKIIDVINALTPGFILVYALCTLAFLKHQKTIIGYIALCFCGFLLYYADLYSLFINLIILGLGVPVFYLTKKNDHLT